MSGKSDELRSRLVPVASELAYAIATSLYKIRRARLTPGQPPEWVKGVDDCLRLLAPTEEAQRQFEKWLNDVVKEEPDRCGLTAAEREWLAGRYPAIPPPAPPPASST